MAVTDELRSLLCSSFALDGGGDAVVVAVVEEAAAGDRNMVVRSMWAANCTASAASSTDSCCIEMFDIVLMVYVSLRLLLDSLICLYSFDWTAESRTMTMTMTTTKSADDNCFVGGETI